MKYLKIVIFLLLLPGVAFASEDRLCVSASIANVRSGPGTQYNVAWQVEKHHPVLVLSKKADWYKIKDFENDTGWLHKSVLKKGNCVITLKDKCNFRSGPTKTSKILFTVEKGVPFKIIKKDKKWIKIQHADGDVGWIYKTLVW